MIKKYTFDIENCRIYSVSFARETKHFLIFENGARIRKKTNHLEYFDDFTAAKEGLEKNIKAMIVWISDMLRFYNVKMLKFKNNLSIISDLKEKDSESNNVLLH